jgi:hypothetical protein
MIEFALHTIFNRFTKGRNRTPQGAFNDRHTIDDFVNRTRLIRSKTIRGPYL